MFKDRVESRYKIKKYLGKTWVHYTRHSEMKFNYKEDYPRS